MAKSKRQRERRREKVSANRRTNEHQSGFSPTCFKLPEGVSLFKPKAGTKRIEIIPFTAGKGNPFADEGTMYYERTYFNHRDIGADQNSYVCLRKTFGKPCPICEYRAKLANDPKADEEVVKALAPKERQLWNVYDHSDPDKGVQLWEVSHHLFGKRLDTEIRNADEDDGYTFFADPDDGFTLRVGFEDKSFAGNGFVEATSINFKPRKSAIDEELLEAALCLDELLTVESYDSLKKIFLQTAEASDDEDEDEDEKPKRSRKPAKSKKVEEDEDEDEDEEDGDDSDIEVGSFVKHGKYGECEVVKISRDGKKVDLEDEDGTTFKGIPIDKVSLVNNDDEEEDEDEDEEDEKPKRGRKSSGGRKSKQVEEDEDEEDDEEEDEDEEDDEEEDEDEEDDEEEDEDEEDDEEEDEPAPKSKSRKPARGRRK